jgi:DNA-binding NarL/FixJ family response regulator
MTADAFPASSRDVALIDCLRQGMTNRQIGTRYGWTESTAKTYVGELMGRLGVHTRGAAVFEADRRTRQNRDILSR